MVVYYHGAMCHAQKLVHDFQCQGHSEGLYNQDLIIFTVFETAGLFATKLGLVAQHHKLECPVEKGVTAFKVKVTVKVHNVSECLSG